jgi:hypothetical protein
MKSIPIDISLVMRYDRFVVDLSQVCGFLQCTLVSVMRCDKYHRNQSTPEKTTDLLQVNNKLITPHHRKLQTCDKSTINLSHLITENYRSVTSQQQTNHTSSQKPEYTEENHRPVTSQQ